MGVLGGGVTLGGGEGGTGVASLRTPDSIATGEEIAPNAAPNSSTDWKRASGFFWKGPHHSVRQMGRYLRIVHGRWRGNGVNMRTLDFKFAGRAERHFAAQHFVESNAKRINIGTRIDRPIQHLLRGHVPRRPHSRIGSG